MRGAGCGKLNHASEESCFFKVNDLVWAYSEDNKKWRRAVIVAVSRPPELQALSHDNVTKEAYVHWKGHDRRLNTWVKWNNIQPFRLENLTREFEFEECESDDHAGISADYLKEHEENTKFKTISSIIIGNYLIDCWYFSPYPRHVQNVRTLIICEFCLSFFPNNVEYTKHCQRCKIRYPPGNEIYRSDGLAMWEVDGGISRVYCENLCFLSKLFLDHKTLRHPVALFLFYILTEIKSDGYHLIGYFSKEKYSTNNVSCILVLPHCQRRSFGKYLMNFSYALSLIENLRGSPERPFSDLGRLGYYNFWKQCILRLIEGVDEFTLTWLADELGFQINDIVTALEDANLLFEEPVLKKHFVYLSPQVESKLKSYYSNIHKPVEEDLIQWVPYDPFLGLFEYSK